MSDGSRPDFTLNYLSEIDNKKRIAVKQFDCGKQLLNTFAAKHLVKRDSDSKIRAIVALNGDELAAFITLAPHQIDNDLKFAAGGHKSVPTLMVEQIATDTRFQKQGIAKRLMCMAFKTAVEACNYMGMAGVSLWAHPDAIPFYESLGLIPLQDKLQNDGTRLTMMFISLDTIKDALSPSAKLSAAV